MDRNRLWPLWLKKQILLLNPIKISAIRVIRG